MVLSSSNHYNFMTIRVLGVFAKTPFPHCECSQLIEAKGLAEREGFEPGRFSNCLVAKGMAKTLVNTAILTQSHSHHISQMSHRLTLFLNFWN